MFLFCILLLGKTRLADTCRPFIGASAYVDMSMYDRIVDYSKPNRWAKLKTLFSHVFLVSSYIFRIDYLCVSDGNRSHCILSFLGSPPVSESLCEHFLLFGFMTCPVERKPSDRFGQFVAANLRRMMQNRRQVRSPWQGKEESCSELGAELLFFSALKWDAHTAERWTTQSWTFEVDAVLSAVAAVAKKSLCENPAVLIYFKVTEQQG